MLWLDGLWSDDRLSFEGEIETESKFRVVLTCSPYSSTSNCKLYDVVVVSLSLSLLLLSSLSQEGPI